MKLTFLNLPSLPVDICSEIMEVCQQVETRDQITPWLEQFHSPVPVASQEYGNQRTTIPMALLQKIIALYQSYFNESFLPILAVTDNVLGVPSSTPPHCDKIRQTAINYVLTTGGESVTTTFYREKRQSADRLLADHCRYENVTVDQQHVLPVSQWHAFDVQTFHSVENITGRRCILSLILRSNPSFQEFVDQYPTLIKG
jgi:hypothetical protein